ncbi:MAG: hypothetical protein EBZ48_10075, partial [Proteobacteria bacterium]|nr:hypothetical protein [Pseudomonadota bacterium]
RCNVFGDQVEDAASQRMPVRPDRSRFPRQPLADEIELERMAPPKRSVPPPRPPEQRGIQDIYDAAEKLIKAGEDLETVAAATRLPLDEVRKLSQIVMRANEGLAEEQIPMSAPQQSAESPKAAAPMDPAADPRLGVFASIRRQTQVL